MLTQAKRTAVKLFALVAAAVMALVMATTALAATITITNTQPGESYKAYKLFDVTTSITYVTDDDGKPVYGEDGEQKTVTNYSYTTDNEALVGLFMGEDADSEAPGITFTSSEAGNLWYVAGGLEDEDDAIALASYLNNLDSATFNQVFPTYSATGTVQPEDTSVTLTVAEPGYYFVTSTVGSLCFLQTSTDKITIVEKNEAPVPEKTVSDENAQIGDEVTFTIDITVPANTVKLVLHDALSDGLDLNEDSFSIAIGERALLNVPAVTIEKQDDGSTVFTMDLTDCVASWTEDATITVTYTATINENAISSNPATNSATVSYGENSSTDISTDSTTTTKTHTLVIKKTDAQGNELDGAEFLLQRTIGTDDDGEPIYSDVYVVPVYAASEDDGNDDPEFRYYRVATSEEINNTESNATTTIVVNGSVIIDGLDAETYTLTETKAPDGYNLLTESETVTVATDNSASITVVNQAGSELPSTGGMGTTVFYIVGGVLVAGAAVLLITRRRMNAGK